MKVVIYGRVSTYSQDVERQIEELKVICKIKNYEVVKVFSETISGVKTQEERKEMSSLIELVSENEEIKGVLVWELSRLGRNTSDVLDLIKKLTNRKVWIFCKKEGLQTLNDDGSQNIMTNFIFSVLTAISELERETIKSRVLSGMKKSVSDGNWLGGKFLPYGYKRDGKKLTIDEEEGEVVKMIFQMYLSGLGTTRIANELNKKNVPTRYNKTLDKEITINKITKTSKEFTWKDGTIYGILTNPLYIGKKEGSKIISGMKLYSPPIIDEDDFIQVKEKLKSTVNKKPVKFTYLFENKLKCGVCGRTYYPHQRENKKDNRYICLSKRYKESCLNYGISIPKLNDAVWSLLRHNQDETKNILKDNNDSETIEKEIGQLEELKTSHKLEIERLERNEGELVDLLLEKKIDRMIYDKRYNSITDRKLKLKEELNDIQEELRDKINLKKKQSNVNNQLRGIKDNKRTLKRVINNVVIRIEINPIYQHNLSPEIFFNKQDKFIYVEVFTYLNSKIPLGFIISQRTDSIIFPKREDYDRKTKSLIIGRNKVDFTEEEEEEEIVIKKLFHLKSLDEN